MLWEALSTARDLNRLQEIVRVLVRHGLGETVRRLGVARALERAGRAVHWKAAQNLEKDPQVRVREAFEELGPAFVKVGQILAGRADLLPPAWTAELAKLQERAAPVPLDQIRAQLLKDLGRPPEEAFARFEDEPLAAASIAQVHRAWLSDGTPVVVKVRRPGIREAVEADLRLLARAAASAEEKVPELRRFRPKSLMREFSRSLRSELDMRTESRNAGRLRANLDPSSPIVIPRVYEEWTRERLLVLDLLEGPSVGQWVRDGRPPGVDPVRVAAMGAETVLRTIFVDGCFHADPHPGNLILLPGGRLGLIDFGMVGYLPESRRLEFLGLLLAVAARDIDGVVGLLLDWSDGEVDVEALSQDCSVFIDHYTGLPLREIDATELLANLMAVLRENNLFLPHDVAMLLKVFITLESVGRQLDPDFVMAAHLEPFARSAARELKSPLAIARRSAREIRSLLGQLPGDLRQLMTLARRGRMRIDIHVDRLDQFAKRLDRSANRVTVGLVTAALIVGTAISLTVDGGPRVAGMPLFGFLGFTSSIAAGMWLLWSIVRSSGD